MNTLIDRIKDLVHSAGDDMTRYHLTFIELDFKNNIASVTDGTKLVRIKFVEKFKTDKTLFISKDDLKTLGKLSKKEAITLDHENNKVNVSSGLSFTLKTREELSYPDVEKLLVNLNEDVLEIGVNLYHLKKLCDSRLKDAHKKDQIVKLVFQKSNFKPIKIETDDCQALLMPCRIK